MIGVNEGESRKILNFQLRRKSGKYKYIIKNKNKEDESIVKVTQIENLR